jgi:hypothetical protein
MATKRKKPAYYYNRILSADEVQFLNHLVKTYAPRLLKEQPALQAMECNVPRALLTPTENLYADQIIQKQKAYQDSLVQLGVKRPCPEYLCYGNEMLSFRLSVIMKAVALWKECYKI